MCQWLRADFSEEMFCSQGWAVACTDTVVAVAPATAEQGEEMTLPRWKAFVTDCLEFNLPLSSTDGYNIQKLMSKAPNAESAQLSLHQYTGQRFFERTLGESVLLKTKDQLGADVASLLKTLLAPVAGYSLSYVAPRREAKLSGASYLSAIIPGELFTREEKLELFSQGKGGTLSRHPVEQREFSSFIEATRSFFGGSVPDEEAKVAFDAITVDIHDKKALDSVKGKHFMLLKNQSCYLFMPRFFFSDNYVIQILICMIFEKNTKEIASHFESRVADLFAQQKFCVVRNFVLMDDGTTDGEVDVLVLRENTLIIIETKMVQPRLLVHNIRSIRDTFQKAGDQLDGAIDLLPAHWPTISRELKISVPYESVRKVTLIVSNSCEYDHQYFNGHLKISCNELECVLRVLPPDMIFDLKQMVKTTALQYIPQQSPPTLDQYRLFPDDSPSVDQMLDCLEQSRYWKLVLDVPIKPTPVFTVQPVDKP